ncbi:MAG: hypothetical protein C4523_12280 [Myxococcales bacterium]|nr:MAG: hypothetical protein C4523_12280 [Myxococcales bacterium]
MSSKTVLVTVFIASICVGFPISAYAERLCPDGELSCPTTNEYDWISGPGSEQNAAFGLGAEEKPLRSTDQGYLVPWPEQSADIIAVFGDTLQLADSQYQNIEMMDTYLACIGLSTGGIESYCEYLASNLVNTSLVRARPFPNIYFPNTLNYAGNIALEATPQQRQEKYKAVCIDLMTNDREGICAWQSAALQNESVFYRGINNVFVTADIVDTQSGYSVKFLDELDNAIRRNQTEEKYVGQEYGINCPGTDPRCFVGTYSGDYFTVCEEGQEDWNACTKRTYFLTDTVWWGFDASPAEIADSVDIARKMVGHGVYGFDKKCRIIYYRPNQIIEDPRSESCIELTDQCAAELNMEEEAFPNRSSGNPNVLWEYGSKFHWVTVVHDLDRDFYSRSTNKQYVYFIGSGELCLAPPCYDVPLYAPTGRVYMARVLANEDNVLCVTRYEYYSGIDEEGYSVWRHDIRQAKPIFDLSFLGVYPASIVKKSGRYWLSAAVNIPQDFQGLQAQAGSLLLNSPDGIHWGAPRFLPYSETGTATSASGDELNNIDAYFYAPQPITLYYAPFWLPSQFRSQDADALSYVFSIWMSYNGFKNLKRGEIDDRFLNYNVKMHRFEIPDHDAALVHHDGYLTGISRPSPYAVPAADRYSHVAALPFQGFWSDHYLHFPPEPVERNVAIQYCDCVDAADEADCKTRYCNPKDDFSESNNWKYVDLEEWAYIGQRPAYFIGQCEDSELGEGNDYLCSVNFKTLVSPFGGQRSGGAPHVPIWRWYSQLKPFQPQEWDGTANVLLRFSYFEVGLTPAQIQKRLIDNIRLAVPELEAGTDEDDLNRYRTTGIIRLKLGDTLPSFDGHLIQPGSGFQNFVVVDTSGLPQAHTPGLTKFDMFTWQAIDLGEFRYADPAAPTIAPGFGMTGGEIDGQTTFYAWGGSSATDSSLHVGHYDESQNGIVWEFFNTGDPYVPEYNGPVMVLDEREQTIYLIGEGDQGVGHLWELGLPKSVDLAARSDYEWHFMDNSPTGPLSYAQIVWKNEREFFLVGGQTDDDLNRTIWLFSLDDIRNPVEAATLPEGRVGTATAFEPQSQRLYVFGGLDEGGSPRNDLIAYSFENQVWLTLSANGNSEAPAPRSFAALFNNFYLNQLAVVGGIQGSETSDDRGWVFNLEEGDAFGWHSKEPEGECGNPSFGDCPEGYYCGDDQKCHPGCAEHEHCTSGNYCENNTCLPFCNDDDDCPNDPSHPERTLCRAFSNQSMNGYRCSSPKKVGCSGCTCDYLDESGQIIDGCTNDPNRCSTVGVPTTSSPWKEAFMLLLLFGLPAFYWGWLRRKSRS